jgi:hypothetical protein
VTAQGWHRVHDVALAGAVMVCLVLGSALVHATLAQEPADPVVADTTVADLRRALLDRDAEMVHLKAEVAVCQANAEQTRRELQSTVLSAEVVKLIEQYKAATGLEWTWDNEQRRIVPAAKEKP